MQRTGALRSTFRCSGQRHCDVKNGLSVPPALKIKNLINMAVKPGWAFSVLAGKRWTFGNLDGYVRGMQGARSLAQWVAGQFDDTLNWNDVEWIRSNWPGKLIIKGILDIEDARRAAKTGASAWWSQITAAGNSMARRLPSRCCRKSAQAGGRRDRSIVRWRRVYWPDILRALALGAKDGLIRPQPTLRSWRRWRSGRRQSDRQLSAKNSTSAWP